MILTGHQPQYLPYIGLFNKIAKSDIFCFVDNVQFEKESWQKRTLIKTPTDEQIFISIPVKSISSTQLIKDIEIADIKMLNKHLKTIEQNYKKAEYFHEIYPNLLKFYKDNIKYLIDLTIPIMEFFINLLNIKTKIVYSSDFIIEGKKTELLANRCKTLGCDVYLLGQGAKNYFEPNIFKFNNLNYLFNYFVHPVYKQTGKKFLEGMAIIDLFFNEGIENSRKIFWDNINNNPKFEDNSQIL